MKLYLDARLVGQNDYRGGLLGNHQPIVVGASVRANRHDGDDLSRLQITRAFDGRIDEVALLGVTLDAAQIAQLRWADALSEHGHEHDDANTATSAAEAPEPKADAEAQALAALRERLADIADDWLVVNDDGVLREAPANAGEQHTADDGTHSDWMIDDGDGRESGERDDREGLVDWSGGSAGSLIAARDPLGKPFRSR